MADIDNWTVVNGKLIRELPVDRLDKMIENLTAKRDRLVGRIQDLNNERLKVIAILDAAINIRNQLP